MEKIWAHIFNELGVEQRKINLLMTDSPFAEKADKQKMADIMFDKFRVNSF